MNDPSRPLGATVGPAGTTFRLWAPHASAVAVIGDFNGWDASVHPMARGEGDIWEAVVEGVGARAEYKYALDTAVGRLQRIDPYARAVTNSVGNGLVWDPEAFDWQGDDFRCPPAHQLVVYETHIGSFVASEGEPGDFSDVVGRLDYLHTLGVNAIELMPVAEFAGDYSWGYNPAHIFAVESSYGGPDAFKRLVREAHRHGIAVILDVVYNHLGPSDLSVWQLDGWSENGKGGIYFYNDHRSSTPWGETRPDYGRPEVRRFLVDNALSWLREFHVDGLRLDMTLYMRRIEAHGGDIDEGWSMMREIADAVRAERPDAITIAEDLQSDPAITASDGARLQSQWDARFVHPIRQAIIAMDDGARSLPAVVAAVTARDHDDAFTRVIYTESHDEVANGKARVPSEIEPANPTGWPAQKRATLGAVLVLTSPGIPMLFQGQEFLEGEWFRDTVPLDWERAESLRDLVRLYRDLIELRRNLGGDSAGLSGQRTDVLHADDHTKLLAYARVADADVAVVVANLSVEPRRARIRFPAAGAWRLRFNSDAGTYSALFTDHPSADVDARVRKGQPHPQAEITIGPYAALVYTR
ncbi:alpha-amylase family glycosyl hydrolase [Pseudactinotalea suaedae]|uniref:alpha-amylase family glycosyl hydrolase n=1 Tax=Pseudactinotalea suaedae TaxID=1524924 RepID=UPI0012E12DA3|nr:alpha-amylase family glycosyl hydrolase [Pseudactinotalea suaedae]